MSHPESPRRRRPGGGRKPQSPQGVTKRVTLTLPPDVAALLAQQPEGERSAYVARAIRLLHDTQPPFQQPDGTTAPVVPATADVLRVMREQSVGQDEAVRILGGTP